ncbi:MAG: SDR family oxidoreductase [Drouetiella hepatica Uher 2000/2452]|jgi:acyl transferase domain-containing protein/acyl carrier protein/phospholipid N-methyltransferase|uniref:Phenolphthiocerol/phthiocerol polyketide synthase subunit E n=1 Tax=Drouetiella hepatica Uher 2000/2452 TaxID=904376 RepID=A0A951UQS6_9CYAN|nr:SDR family oxidoreductase [Drouetiella hepatica Uher 2000/2452]
MNTQFNGLEIAIIGLAGRFPGSQTLDQFWENLKAGVELVSAFSSTVLSNAEQPSPTAPSHQDDRRIKAGAVLTDIEYFDAAFFGFNPREAESMDPQHRLFLECAWEALENAGYTAATEEKSIGVYAGVGMGTYLLHNLSPNPEWMASKGFLQTLIGVDKDYLPTRVSYKLNLTGPSVSVGTACSSSLVAVHLACQSLLSGECDMAIAAGVAVKVPQTELTLSPDEIVSPDGHCKAFDAKANGTVGGNGLGAVVLKRLEDAIADRDAIYAVIKGSAINNDGALKVGYTAPSQAGQAKVIRAAQVMAEVEPDTISYLETHGTGTALGDPIEVAAMTQAFRIGTANTGFCAIGSVKTNVGHLDAAAGMAGLIKTVLSLHHKVLPPSLNFETPNPEIDFANSPFYVNTKLTEWNVKDSPRRAGVSSFGFGGTNVHMVLEEAPPPEVSSPSRPHQLLLLSAKTRSALDAITVNLAQYLQQHPDLNLADVAYTLQIGRTAFEHRRVAVCSTLDEAVESLGEPQYGLIDPDSDRPVVFMFTGQGAQYVNMARELYQCEPTFREVCDRCCTLLHPQLGFDLRQVLYPTVENVETATQQLQQTAITQPALFVIEYALAQLWMSWGVQPVAMIGHSIGEYVAACLAGVFSLEDALSLVVRRGQLMQQQPKGAMLSVELLLDDVQRLIRESGKKLSIAANNSPALNVVSGTVEAIESLERQLTDQGVNVRRLHTSHAFHSEMMEAIAEPFTLAVKHIQLHPPQIPLISNVTGTWMTATDATDPLYWAKHLRQTVRFSEGIAELLQDSTRIFLEVGPGRTLATLTKQQAEGRAIFSSLRHPHDRQSDMAFLLNTLGRLWLAGVQVDGAGFYQHEKRDRLPLPTYPFERQRYWIDPPPPSTQSRAFQPLISASEQWNCLLEAGQAQDTTATVDQPMYLANQQGLAQLSLAYINLALRSLGAFSDINKTYSDQELFDRYGIIPRYQLLVSQWLQVLVEQGHLQQDQGRFTHLISCSLESVNALLETVRVEWADSPQVIDLVQRCGENLRSVLIGKTEPLTLFKGLLYDFKSRTPPQADGVWKQSFSRIRDSDCKPQSFAAERRGIYPLLDSIENLASEFPSHSYYSKIIRAILQQAVESLPSIAHLRILEIGSGIGHITDELLPLLPLSQTHYCFADVGNSFFHEASKRFSQYASIACRALDLDQPLTEQGFAKHSVDVAIAVKSLHIAKNIEASLQQIHELLAPGGFLLVWEKTQQTPDFYMTWALLMNPAQDEAHRLKNPYLSQEQWQDALQAGGFVQVAAFLETDVFGQRLLIAQAATSASPSVPAAFTAPLQPSDSIHSVRSGKKPDLADWFYVPTWKRALLPQPFQFGIQTPQSERWLVFGDRHQCDLAAQLLRQLQHDGQDVITVGIGEQFVCQNQTLDSPQEYTLNPQNRDDYDALLKALQAQNWIPTQILHLWTIQHDTVSTLLETVDQTQVTGFYSLLFLVQALGKQNVTQALQLAVVSNHLQSVTGEEPISPEKSTVLGVVKVIPQEYPNIRCRSIDVLLPDTDSRLKLLIDSLLIELRADTSDDIIVYRGKHRWIPAFDSVRLDETFEGTSRLRQGGVYLITGGLGAIGLALASHLAQTAQAKLILIGRSAFPDRQDWETWLTTHDKDDQVSDKIRKLKQLEDLGAEVWVTEADVTQLEPMQQTIAQAQTRFGQINGVIHAAGILKEGAIGRTTAEDAEKVLAPKVKGALVLDAIFKEVQLDFFICCSSRAAINPVFGQMSYAAANTFLDAFAHYKTVNAGTPTISINWISPWQEGGIAVEAAKKLAQLQPHSSSSADLLKHGLSDSEGIKAFSRIVGSSFPQVLVSTTDLFADMDQQEYTLFTSLDTSASQDRKESTPSTYPRPSLSYAYVPPRNELEQAIAQIWQQFLGIDPVGIHDSFFELGGHSLMATQVMAQMSGVAQVNLSMNVLFEQPTVAEIAQYIERIRCVAHNLQSPIHADSDDRAEIEL